jgi:hypothetical protein
MQDLHLADANDARKRTRRKRRLIVAVQGVLLLVCADAPLRVETHHHTRVCADQALMRKPRYGRVGCALRSRWSTWSDIENYGWCFRDLTTKQEEYDDLIAFKDDPDSWGAMPIDEEIEFEADRLAKAKKALELARARFSAEEQLSLNHPLWMIKKLFDARILFADSKYEKFLRRNDWSR